MKIPPPFSLPERVTTAGLTAALSCILTVVAPPPAAVWALEAQSTFEDKIERVVDGDTLVLSQLGRVRLIGMNTPETVAPAQRQGAPAQCYGPEASAATKALLPSGTAVRLETDAAPQDKYGRTLAYVYREPDDVFVNGRLVEEGYARAKSYAPNTRYDGLLASYQKEAKAKKKGLWGACSGAAGAATAAPSAAPKAALMARGSVAPGSTGAAPLPNPGDSKNCADFSSYAEAKAWYDRYFPLYGDVARLDGDGDGKPCESLLRGG